MIARYRIVYFVADPFTQSRIAIGALSQMTSAAAFQWGIAVDFVRFDSLPNGLQLTGASLLLVDHVCADLKRKPGVPGKNRHGLCFEHGDEQCTPDVDSPRDWLRKLGGSRSEAQQ